MKRDANAEARVRKALHALGLDQSLSRDEQRAFGMASYYAGTRAIQILTDAALDDPDTAEQRP